MIVFEIPEDEWSDSLDNGSVLRTTIYVNGIGMHLEAHEVETCEFLQSGRGDSDYEALHAAFECQEPCEEITIRGRQYVLFAVAFGD